MQYISSFSGLSGPTDAHPNVFLFDSREEPTVSATNLTDANLLAKRARSVLGFNGFCNTVRGRKAGRYYFCPLKYTRLRSALIEATTDIVSYSGAGTISGLTTFAEEQSYGMGVGINTTLFLTYGVKSMADLTDPTVVLPPVQLAGTNCPYGQSGTVNIGFRYVHDQGNQFTYTASITTNVSACDKTIAIPTSASISTEFKLLQAAVSAGVVANSGYGTPALSAASTTDARMYQRQADLADESVILDKAFCYHAALKAFISLSSDDFVPVSADPGTQPKISFKYKKLTV
ncbi:hypothetical protein pEaSNUABM40_00201 [Erwinia phage pEa_SNUABM_40]|nr:hypothetical protein pEaSNUABM20_00198 [Erwinia phage pEa_SNUABM_20]QZE58417.1 hypothetical protein pEaSNUABM40_00201 [Erwinia phage pEa_SNUABM_40]UAW52979.1 hypothetical protein pEaSNUABM23_00197 [Erwinia phage pEa_SNUABM_23]UIW10875.1 hypothetical protein pEaSNUABM23_00197 [Erwinia phage pEa_SNUABM_31]